MANVVVNRCFLTIDTTSNTDNTPSRLDPAAQNELRQEG
jgi:hypothetical protein